MELRVLGALEVWHDGEPCALRASKPRQLLTLLATRPGEPVGAQVLIDELWEGDAPATAASALRVHVGQVRQVLEPDRAPGLSTRLPLLPSGYVLRVAPEELDSWRFEALVISAREANALGDPAGAESQLTAALALWRGPALADAQGLSAVALELARLGELRIRAIDDLAEARLALGQDAAVIELLRDATEEFPLHEAFTARLMLALYRSDRHADALRAFGRLEHELDEQLGIQPSSRLRQLEEDVLLQRSHLEYAPREPDQCAVAVSRLSGPRLVGRRNELGALLDAAASAAAGDRRFVLVSGAAGIGKTTLVSEFSRRATNLGASVFAGACVADRAGGYEAVIEILAAVSRRLDHQGAAGIERLFPDRQDNGGPAEALVSRDLEIGQLRLFEAIVAAIRELGDRRVVLVVEDLHWAGRTTLLVLRHLMRLSDLDNLLVVATVRDEDLDAEQADLIAHLAPAARTRLLQLDGLDDHEVRVLIRATAHEALVDLTPKIRDATDGNPFFIRALLGDLDDVASGDRRALEARIAEAAPSGVRTLIDRRVANVSSGARAVLEASAVLGAEFSLETVEAVCALHRNAALEAIEELLDARLLVEDAGSVDRFAFPHALVRNAVYVRISETRRCDLHFRCGEVLEQQLSVQQAVDCAQIAYQYCEAGARCPDAKAAESAERAASEAAQRFAFAEAAEWYERSLQRWAAAGKPSRAATLLALGLACDGSRQASRAQAAYAAAAVAASAAGDAQLLVDIALAASWAWTSGLDVQPDAERLLVDALDLLGATDPRRRIHLLSRLATVQHYVDPDRQRSLVAEACSLAEAGDVDGSSVAIALLARHTWLTHDPEARRERLDISRRALAISFEDSTPPNQLRIERELLSDLLENGDVDAFDRELDDYEALAKVTSSARDVYWSMALRATQATLRGDLSMAERLARGALLRGQDLHQDAFGAEFLQKFVVRYEQGRLSELVSGLRQATGMQPAYRAGSALAAMACAETGDPAEAARIAHWALGPNGDHIQRDVLWLGALSLFCGVAARAADVELAELLDDLISPCSEHIVIFGVGGAVLGQAHYWRGVAAATRSELERAIEHLEEAIHTAERIGAPFWAAQAQIDLAEVLARRGRRASGPSIRELTDRALATAAERGFGRILAQVRNAKSGNGALTRLVG